MTDKLTPEQLADAYADQRTGMDPKRRILTGTTGWDSMRAAYLAGYRAAQSAQPADVIERDAHPSN